MAIPHRFESSLEIVCKEIKSIEPAIIGTCEGGLRLKMRGACLDDVLEELCGMYGEAEVVAWVTERPAKPAATPYESVQQLLKQFAAEKGYVGDINDFGRWLEKKVEREKLRT